MNTTSLTEQQIVEKLCELAAEHASLERPTISLDAHFRHDLGFDSLEEVEFVLDIEECFEIDVPDEEATEIRTIRDAAEMLKRRLGVG